jgi:aspartate carbamoyltransferase catalytic subunit
MRSFAGRDILSLNGFERAEFEHVFEICDELEPIARKRENVDLLKDKTLLTAFYQPSTRTRLAHEAAMHRLGGHVLGFADPKMTRAGDFYQESIKDTVHMLEYYADVIVMRHFQQGAPHEAAKWSSVPVINAGDGWGEHPTQVLTDLYTVEREMGSVDGLTFLAVGDWRMRTMHSLGYALTQFDADIAYVCPDDMAPTDEFLAEVEGQNLRIKRYDHVEECIDQADVIYMEPVVQADYTASREEAGGEDKGLTPDNFKVTRELLAAKAKPDSIILHSLPRMDELPPDVDATRHARYWQEAYYGVVMRMSLLSLVLGAME